MQKNGFLTLCFSFIPGAGQMYQGYMKRGVTQVLLFVIPLMIGGVFLPVLMVLSAVVYMYSFFDSLNLRAQLRQGIVPEDAFLFSWDGGEDLARLVDRRHHLIGWTLVVLGVAGPNIGQEGSAEDITAFLEENGYTYPVVMDETGTLFYQYGISAYPTTFMIDTEGNVFGYVQGAVSREVMDDIVEQTRTGQRR